MTSLFRKPFLLLATVAAIAVPASALAQVATEPASAPAPAAAAAPADEGLSAICTDRPTKSYASCTVDPGHLQIETDLFNATLFSDRGQNVDTFLFTNPTLKLGVAKGVDIEANIAPYVRVHSYDDAGTYDDTVDGVGDLYLRLKYNFYNSANGKLQLAAIPYVKAPTAKAAVGNEAWEGGAAFAINYKLTDVWSLNLAPEVDVLKDSTGDGRHVQHVELINIARSLPHGVTAYAELWGAWNYDPAGTVRQYSADFAVAWAFAKHTQVDLGVNFGLNRYTPDAQVYLGLSQKF